MNQKNKRSTVFQLWNNNCFWKSFSGEWGEWLECYTVDQCNDNLFSTFQRAIKCVDSSSYFFDTISNHNMCSLIVLVGKFTLLLCDTYPKNCITRLCYSTIHRISVPCNARFFDINKCFLMITPCDDFSTLTLRW